MLRRNCLQDKKKKKKTDIDKKKSTMSNLIEREIKEQNSKKAMNDRVKNCTNALEPGHQEYITLSLDQMDPNHFVFMPSSDLTGLYDDLKVHLEDFKNLNNEYIQIKLQEEKMKVSYDKLIFYL